MREIKFKAICNADGVERMVYFGAQEFDNGIQAWPLPNNISCIYEYLSPLMQYTGLKDKNGKEIYEDDIVKVNHPYDVTGDFTNTVGRVFWYEEEAGFYHGNSSGRPPKKMFEYCEVIGNIYENPDLSDSSNAAGNQKPL